jgi:two-component system, NtrC family, nitrogen regulation response regulator NtrX
MDTSSLSILVVDDDPMVRSTLGFLLESRGYAHEAVGDLGAATRALAARHFDAVLLDMYLPDGDGRTLLDRALELEPPPGVLMMTGRAQIRSAVDAIRRGAADFLEKPLDLDDLAARLDRVLETATLKRKLAAYEAKHGGSAVAESPAIREVLSVAARVAGTPSSSALLVGESGVGKEVIATRIHELSDRRNGPFVRVNLAAIAESMVEAELFGSVRGAFTDSKRDRAGHFASGEGGTLLLDEICEFKVELQPKLLRALEERRFFPVGSDRERRMNVRVLAATNKDPMQQIAKGLLREDLYYRLATVVIRIPPLRERKSDILPTAEHFCAAFSAEFRRAPVTLSGEAKQALQGHSWPGNVRELRNVIERALMLGEGSVIGADDLGLTGRSKPPTEAPPAAPADEAVRLDEVERRHIVRILEQTQGSRTRAAELLGISRSTLWEKGKRYGLF